MRSLSDRSVWLFFGCLAFFFVGNAVTALLMSGLWPNRAIVLALYPARIGMICGQVAIHGVWFVFARLPWPWRILAGAASAILLFGAFLAPSFLPDNTVQQLLYIQFAFLLDVFTGVKREQACRNFAGRQPHPSRSLGSKNSSRRTGVSSHKGRDRRAVGLLPWIELTNCKVKFSEMWIHYRLAFRTALFEPVRSGPDPLNQAAADVKAKSMI